LLIRSIVNPAIAILLATTVAWPARNYDPAAPSAQAQPTTAPSSSISETEFKRLAADILGRRLNGVEETETGQEQALQILDRLALETFNAPGDPQLDSLNQRLATLVTQRPPIGEGYVAQRLGGLPAVFALTANFGSSGPSAVRIYARGPQGYGVAARIDHFSQPDLFDDYLVLVPLQSADIVFVTATGRSDRLSTGMFAAWRIAQERLVPLWSSDLLTRSSYEAGPDGFRLTYCAQPDDDRPSVCRKMTRDRYTWDGAAWKRAEQSDVPLPKP
jgi:hypothetical protein